MADVVLPAAAGWCESDGTVTNSERRVQRVRKALDPPGQARDDMAILCDLARRFGHDWGQHSAEEVWNELRSLSPMHAGMSYARLGMPQIAKWMGNASDAEHKVAELAKKVAPYQTLIGLVGIVSAVIFLYYRFIKF